ncbi:AT-hook DNA-binding motif-containing protein 1 [Clupea harengus]|uniref:AT-hook DNA-binding motif-containing protein 1 n=1 Tax=Clupea harengus TaxID=7950 RepID=A0A6P8GTG3_CLUHA|nr:AT-hook DNA-binding motif-containing protein 1 [Clupea harengus]
MSGLSGRLRSGGVRVVCGGVAEEECVEPEAWGADRGATVASGSIGPRPSASALHYSVYPSHALANGLRSHDNQHHMRRHRNEETTNTSLQQDHSDSHTFTHLETDSPLQQLETHTAQTLMHTESQTPAYTQGDTHSEMDLESSAVQPQTHRQTPSPLLKPMPPAHTSLPSTPLSPDPSKPNHTTNTTDPVPVASPAELERKYTLRSSGRPRFPSHLRKSSRLRRVSESTKDKQEDVIEEEEVQVKREERTWRGGEAGERVKTEQAPEVTPPAPCNPHPPPHCTPPASTTRGVAECPVGPPHMKRKGRFKGARRIVVKVPRIPVHLSRRQKSYKISSLEAVSWVGGGKDVNMGLGSQGKEGAGPPREPTALLRMKNNGKSVMVMFPPGELPVILKRRRGRPPKQALPGQPDLKETRAAAAAIAAAGGNGDMPKKPRRRRRVKLPSPQPCYVTETNDTYNEYADVLSKLAFLTRQPPPTGRCSPPRCWTPTQPESASDTPPNPALPMLLQRLSGFRRRGGRGGGAGVRGGGASGLGANAPKSDFCDFFETIGKKQKKGMPSEPGAPRKRGKGGGPGGAGGTSRASHSEKMKAGEVDPMAPPGEKPPRKRRSRKNGLTKAGKGVAAGDDWANGNMAWEGKDTPERETGARYGPMSCAEGRGSGGMYGSPGVQSSGGDEAQGLFAGYFRSLLDSDDSSDLIDISSPPARKTPVGFEGSPQRWSPAFPKCSPKGQSTPVDGGLPQAKSSSSTPVRPSYPYGQISPTTLTYSKSSALSQSRSPSSPHPSTGYTPFPSGYTSSTATHTHIPAGAVSSPNQTQQRVSDCSFAFGAKASSSPSAQCQMGYANYQPAAKCSYGAYSPGHSALMRGEGNGPTSPGGGYMMMSKSSHHASSASGSPPEEYRQYPGQWGYRQAWGGGEGFAGGQYHTYAEYTGATTSPESKDILDISNYTPQKTKQRPCSDTLSESSSDSSHISGGGRAVYRQREVPVVEGQSSLSSLEKLMMDWNESSTGPSFNWSQSMLFQGGAKPGRGRRKHSESPQGEKEACPPVAMPPGSPVSPSSHSSGPKRVGVAVRGSRGSRGGRYGYSPCQRERSTTKSKLPSQKSPTRSMFQETLDYYSGDSSSLSPMSHGPETCEYPSPYSGHSSTASSDERISQIYPTDSTSLSPSPSVQLDVLKPYPKPAQAPPSQPYCSSSSRTFSPTLSPTPRLLPQCGSSVSKEPISQYDSPRYSSSPCWYNPHAYEDARPPSKRELPMMSPGLRAMPPSPYPAPLQRGPSHTGACEPEEYGYPRGGVLCQLLDQSSEDCFTSL